MFEGTSKPENIDEFLNPLVSELIGLFITSFEDITLQTGNYIMDAPARSLILRTKRPPGYYACHKCFIRGYYSHIFHTVVFEGTGHPLQTHEQFCQKHQYDDDQTKSHHTSPFRTRLEDIPGIDVVKHNPCDYMHSACSGLMKKCLETWVKNNPDIFGR